MSILRPGLHMLLHGKQVNVERVVAVTQPYLPEGRLIQTEENQTVCSSIDGLREAMEHELILEGQTLLCDAGHDLVVRVGPYTGLIPRDEGALGIAEGTTREIAILSRVGKPISFTVQAVEGTSLLLSRRRAQQMALEHLLSHWRKGQVIPVTVTHLEPFGAFVDVGCGLPSLLTLEHISVSRIPHPAIRFSVGQELSAVVTGLDPELRRVYLTHKALWGTWAENAARFAPGMTVTGTVRSVKDYGAFIELAPNLSGLAEPYPELREGDRVSVFLKSIQPERHKIKLSVIDRLPPQSLEPLPCYFFRGAYLEHWRYLPDDPDLY